MITGMQFLWLLIGLISVTYSAVPDAPRREEARRPGHGGSGHQVDCNGPVVFSAVTTPNRAGKSNRNHIIIFETSLLDRAVGYDKGTGIFTSYCPGLYQITYTVNGEDNNSKFSLRKRPSSLTSSWTTLVTSDKKGGGHTIFLEMEVGEQAAVFVDTGSLSTSSHTFSGYRISKK